VNTCPVTRSNTRYRQNGAYGIGLGPRLDRRPKPALQLAALKKAGYQTVLKDEGLSGATTKRPALLRRLKKLEHGDTLIVWKLDRLGRSLVCAT
jgi:DNA invertase Pin-like site-specific DNA recombinase